MFDTEIIAHKRNSILDKNAKNQYNNDMKMIASQHFLHKEDFCNVTFNPLKAGFPVHVHDYVEITIMLAGEAIHNYGGKEYRVRKGDTFVVSGDTEHSFHSSSDDFLVGNVMYRPAAINQLNEYLQKIPGYQALFIIEPAHRSVRESQGWLRLDELELKRVVGMMERLQTELKGRSAGFECMMHSYLVELIVTLSRLYSQSSGSHAGGFLRLGETVAWMDAHFMEEVSLSTLARRAHMSERHFLRMFRLAFQTTPLKYMNKLRIQQACTLLDRGDLNISECAMKSGFADSNYFSRQFRQITGISPREYLRRNAR